MLALRRPVAQLFGAKTAYALWLLPAIRLVLPPLPIAIPGLAPMLPPIDLVVAVDGAAASLPPTGGLGQELPWLLATWAGGAAAFLLWQGRRYRGFLARLSLGMRSIGDVGGIPLLESAAAEGPLALGLLDRRIFVPTDFADRYDPEERRLALAHELVHHRRGDLWWNAAALLILAAHWFDPIAWIAFRAFREDQELACDAAVAVVATDPDARHAYGRALVKSASRPGLIAACPLNHADQLKRRLRMMKDHRSSRARAIGGALAVTLLAAMTTTLGTPLIAHPHPEGKEGEGRRERIIIMDHHGEGAETGAAPRVRRFTMRRGEDGAPGLPEECPEDRQLANVDTADGERRTHILLCSREANVDPARRVEALQRARERLAANDHIAEEHRQRVIEALDREIAQARGQ